MGDDDYFGAAAPPSADWAPQAPPYQTPGRPATHAAQSPVALGVVLGGALMCLGAFAPWLHASAYGETFHYSGMHSQLDGRWVLGVGFVVLILGVLLLAAPQGRETRAAVNAACVVLGVVGLVVAIHEHNMLSSRFRLFNDLFSSYFSIHIGAGWGLWLSGLGSACAVLSGGLAFVL